MGSDPERAARGTMAVAMTTWTLPLTRPNTLRKQVLKLALPAVGEQFLNLLVALVDTFLVGHL